MPGQEIILLGNSNNSVGLKSFNNEFIRLIKNGQKNTTPLKNIFKIKNYKS
jgi:hypothetical protein